MFKKLFGRKTAPTKEGKKAIKVDNVRWVKKFSLELSNMEGTPAYLLSHQLTVGSEVGNIVIADPSVSPRHCTFVLQEEVISVIDHGSVSGTTVNGQKIPPGKSIILEETDVVLAGDLEIKILVENTTIQEDISEDDLEEEDEDQEEPEEKKPVVKPIKNGKSKSKSKGMSFSSVSSYSTNSLVRVLAVFSDVLISYTLFVIFSPFDEFRTFVNDVPSMLGDLLQIDWAYLWATLNEDFGFIGPLIEDLYGFISGAFDFGPLILLFFLVRFVSTLLFGVSVSEIFLGVRSHGNAIWKRLGGALRVIIGMVTGPLIIFDVPAIVSRRTFKEFMTFTHTYLASKIITTLGVILYIPLLGAMALLSPLFQGLEINEPIFVSERLEKRIKVTDAAATGEVSKIVDKSQLLGLKLEYDPATISIIPQFKFSGEQKRLNFKPSLAFYHRDLQRTVTFEVFKKFDLKELLGIGIKGNFLLYDKYPELYNFVYSEGTNRAFKKEPDDKSNQLFANQVVGFTKSAFSLGFENALEFMQTETPFLKSLVDYRSSFLALVEYKEFDQISFVKLGNGYFLKLSYLRQKPFDLLIPLIRGDGRIFKVEFDTKEQLQTLANKFYKFNLEGSDWYVSSEKLPSEALTPLQVVDFFSNSNFKVDKIDPEIAQALYGYYFEKSAEVLKKEDATEYALWKKSVDGVFGVMEKLKASIPATPVAVDEVPEQVPAETSAETPAPIEPPAPVEDPRLKLFQNFQDLKDAIDNKNKVYFGAEEGFSV